MGLVFEYFQVLINNEQNATKNINKKEMDK